jgi:hypothetical protein
MSSEVLMLPAGGILVKEWLGDVREMLLSGDNRLEKI